MEFRNDLTRHTKNTFVSRVFIKLLFVMVFFSISSCAVKNIRLTDTLQSDQVSTTPIYSKQAPHVSMSEDKKYRITVYSEIFPIPMQKIHSWPLHIEYPNGKPLLNAKIYIHGGMPKHRHEFPTVPRVRKNLGNGDFLIEGLKFNMHGDWELRINIKEEKQRDRVIFHIKLTP